MSEVLAAPSRVSTVEGDPAYAATVAFHEAGLGLVVRLDGELMHHAISADVIEGVVVAYGEWEPNILKLTDEGDWDLETKRGKVTIEVQPIPPAENDPPVQAWRPAHYTSIRDAYRRGLLRRITSRG